MAIEPATAKRKTKKPLIIGAIIAVVVLILGALAWSWYASVASGSVLQADDVTEVTRGDVTNAVSANGTVAAREEAVLSTRLTGPVSSVRVGDRVQAHQPLAVIDTTPEEQELAGQRATQRTELRSAQNQVADAQAELDRLYTAAANGETESAATGATGEGEEGAAAAAGDIQTQIAAQERALARAQEDVSAAQESANLANAGLENSINAGTLSAPFEGVVTALNAREGSPAEGPVATVADDSTLEIRTTVNEVDMPNLRPGNRVTFTSPSAPGKEFAGKVTGISPVAQQPKAAAGAGAGGDSAALAGQGGATKATFPVTIEVTATPRACTSAPRQRPRSSPRRKNTCPPCR
ncbi:efflux RND transporter periplasmic adaptor subunit [Corynebacterium sp. 32222D000AT]|uniref:efflux RND transporter periplasmic adaptor subunit n=1 Tax=unclassified Corynebacterium TaxID=2624378 RepID=UPI002A9314D5|nr:efflux RND transporter periplasmic adaptor subunit [Mycobacteriaceae bacterium]MDY5828335.1 efflux RND transporter periplasmic adaptor subunit [Corynebacterium sp.]